jgi:hypothetical protein
MFRIIVNPTIPTAATATVDISSQRNFLIFAKEILATKNGVDIKRLLSEIAVLRSPFSKAIAAL